MCRTKNMEKILEIADLKHFPIGIKLTKRSSTLYEEIKTLLRHNGNPHK